MYYIKNEYGICIFISATLCKDVKALTFICLHMLEDFVIFRFSLNSIVFSFLNSFLKHHLHTFAFFLGFLSFEDKETQNNEK